MKTITIEKGQVAFYSSLSADTLVVNGVLKVNGTLKVRRLLGRGIVDARRLEAESVNIRTGFVREMEIGSGIFGELYGTTCRASGTLCAQNFIQTLEVSAKQLVMDRSNIGSCTAQEVVSLRRYLPNKLLSGLKRLLTAPFRRLMKPKKKAVKKPALSPLLDATGRVSSTAPSKIRPKNVSTIICSGRSLREYLARRSRKV